MYKIRTLVTVLIFLSVVYGKGPTGIKYSDDAVSLPNHQSNMVAVSSLNKGADSDEAENIEAPDIMAAEIAETASEAKPSYRQDPVWHVYAKPKIAWINEKATQAKSRHYFRNPLRKWLIKAVENSGTYPRNIPQFGALAYALVLLL